MAQHPKFENLWFGKRKHRNSIIWYLQDFNENITEALRTNHNNPYISFNCFSLGTCWRMGFILLPQKGCCYEKKIIITITLVNIEITIIETIIFLEFENMMYLFSMSLSKTLCNWEL